MICFQIVGNFLLPVFLCNFCSFLRMDSIANAVNLDSSATLWPFTNPEIHQAVSLASVTLSARTWTTKRSCPSVTASQETAVASPTSLGGIVIDAQMDTLIWTAEM
jgi:hypothetical protein